MERRHDRMDRWHDWMDRWHDWMDRWGDWMNWWRDRMDRRRDWGCNGMDRRHDRMDRRRDWWCDGMDRRRDGMDRRYDRVNRRHDRMDRRHNWMDRWHDRTDRGLNRLNWFYGQRHAAHSNREVVGSWPRVPLTVKRCKYTLATLFFANSKGTGPVSSAILWLISILANRAPVLAASATQLTVQAPNGRALLLGPPGLNCSATICSPTSSAVRPRARTRARWRYRRLIQAQLRGSDSVNTLSRNYQNISLTGFLCSA